MKRVLVIGGAGLISSHPCERLLARSDEMGWLDDRSTARLDNVVHLRDDARFTFMWHDVTIPLELQVDEIQNLACPPSPLCYRKAPVRTLKTCVYGAANLLELVRSRHAKLF